MSGERVHVWTESDQGGTVVMHAEGMGGGELLVGTGVAMTPRRAKQRALDDLKQKRLEARRKARARRG